MGERFYEKIYIDRTDDLSSSDLDFVHTRNLESFKRMSEAELDYIKDNVKLDIIILKAMTVFRFHKIAIYFNGVFSCSLFICKAEDEWFYGQFHSFRKVSLYKFDSLDGVIQFLNDLNIDEFTSVYRK